MSQYLATNWSPSLEMIAWTRSSSDALGINSASSLRPSLDDIVNQRTELILLMHEFDQTSGTL